MKLRFPCKARRMWAMCKRVAIPATFLWMMTAFWCMGLTDCWAGTYIPPDTGADLRSDAETGIAPVQVMMSPQMATAISLMRSGRLDDAIAEFRNMLDRDRYDLEALLGVAACYELKGHQSLAMASYRNAFLFNRYSAGAAVGYMSCAQRSGRLSEALSFVRKLFRPEGPKSASAYWEVGVWLVDYDYWQAQYFARYAHYLDPVRFPKERVEPKPLVMRRGLAAPVQAQPQPSVTGDPTWGMPTARDSDGYPRNGVDGTPPPDENGPMTSQDGGGNKVPLGTPELPRQYIE